MNKRDAKEMFREAWKDVQETCPNLHEKDDKKAAWNDYIDMLLKARLITIPQRKRWAESEIRAYKLTEITDILSPKSMTLDEIESAWEEMFNEKRSRKSLSHILFCAARNGVVEIEPVRYRLKKCD